MKMLIVKRTIEEHAIQTYQYVQSVRDALRLGYAICILRNYSGK